LGRRWSAASQPQILVKKMAILNKFEAASADSWSFSKLHHDLVGAPRAGHRLNRAAHLMMPACTGRTDPTARKPACTPGRSGSVILRQASRRLPARCSCGAGLVEKQPSAISGQIRRPNPLSVAWGVHSVISLNAALQRKLSPLPKNTSHRFLVRFRSSK
jgi:hypothetical protein